MLMSAVAMLLCQSAFAAQTVELKLQDAMQRAFDTNPTITIAAFERDSARASYNAARQSRGITITATHVTERGGYNDNQQTVLPDGSTYWSKQIENSHSNAITASLPIYTGGQLKGTIKQAKATYLYNEIGVQRSYNEMRSTVTTGYFNMLQMDNLQKLSQEEVDRLADHLKNVQSQYDVGVVAKVDVLRSQVELSNAQQDLIVAENNYQVAEANLNKIVGLPLSTNLILENILVYTPYDNDLEYCLDYAAKNRPELEQAWQNVEAAKGALKVAISGHLPQIYATASQQWSSENWPGDENGNWGVGVTVTLNLFDTGVTQSNIHGAQADLASAKETYRDTVDSVNLEVRTDYLNMREAERRIQSTGLAVEQAEEDYRIAQLQYMSGVGTNTDVLDAQVALTEAKTNYLDAIYDFNTSKVDLETAMGVPMAYPVKINLDPEAAKDAAAIEAANKQLEKK